MNILTFDVEEWFHLLDFDDTRGEEQWKNFEVRIHENVDRILDILDSTGTKATFFIIGWIAKTYPEVVKKIAEKYQIGSHTMTHQLVWQQTPAEFRSDVESSIKLLEDITSQPIKAFRAPGFSIRESEAWAFDILSELGIEYDCSVFPAAHAHGGMPSYSHPGPSIIKHDDVEMKEFPVSIKNIGGKHLIFSGGGYFRLFPYSIIKKWSQDSGDYLLSYIHPRDLDAGQPKLEGLPMTRQFKSYVGLSKAEEKLRRYLNDLKFIDLETASSQIDWAKAPRVEI
ncbi:MAG: polysaccharide deacetylase family protein [Bacteroidales bacterium]|nr:polysaccharide deacetylase family protein [Bacteroidales bacterium]